MTVLGEGEKRCNWKLAVVEELITVKDKEVRGAKALCLNRHIQKLLPLEVQDRLGGKRKERGFQTVREKLA